MPRASVIGHHWGLEPAQNRAAVAQPRAADRSSPVTYASEILEEACQWLNAKGINQWTVPFSSSWISEHIEDGELYIANSDNLTVGVFRLLWSDPKFWEEDAGDAVYIHSLAVRRSFRGQGIGHYLLKWEEKYSA